MKVLENKSTEITAQATEQTTVLLKYADLIKIVCNTPMQGGFGITDIKSRIAILAACENIEADAEILLENTDAAYLQTTIKNMKWSFFHKDLVTFTEDVEKMKEEVIKKST